MHSHGRFFRRPGHICRWHIVRALEDTIQSKYLHKFKHSLFHLPIHISTDWFDHWGSHHTKNVTKSHNISYLCVYVISCSVFSILWHTICHWYLNHLVLLQLIVMIILCNVWVILTIQVIVNSISNTIVITSHIMMMV